MNFLSKSKSKRELINHLQKKGLIQNPEINIGDHRVLTLKFQNYFKKMYCYSSRTFKLQSILNYNSTPSRSIIKFYLPTIHPSNRRKIILKPASRFNTLTPFHFPPPRSMYCCVFYITKPESVPMNLARTTLRANLRLLLLCCSSRLFFPLASVLRLLHHIFSTIRITYVDGKLLQDTPHQYHIIRSA